MTKGERVKIIRTECGMTMQEFATALGVTKPAISLIESGKNNLAKYMQILICEKFNINEEWLESGVGEMRMAKTYEQEVADLVAMIVKDPKAIKSRFLMALSQMSESELETLLSVANKLSEIIEKGGD